MNTRKYQQLFRATLYAIPMLFLFSCSIHQNPRLDTVDAKVDINTYSGKWYEIASFPNSFQKGCHCTTAEYSKNPKQRFIGIVNSCRKDSVTGKLSVARGKAFVVPNSNNTKFKVQFFWPFRGNYWILALGDPKKKYEYALIGNPSRKYLWILSRTPTMSKQKMKAIEKIARSKLFDVSKLRLTDQSCQQ